jgi:hypothetical protein
MSKKPKIQNQINEITNHLFRGKYTRMHLEEQVILGHVNIPSNGQDFLDDFEELLIRSIDSSARHVRLNHNGNPLMLPNDIEIQHGFCRSRYEEGASIILNGIDDMCQRYADACSSIDNVYSKRTVASMYLTPKNSRGFDPHFDMDDVIVLQVAGTKKWYFENLAVKSAIRRLANGVTANYEEKDSLILYPGDWCFIPAGYVHHAKSLEDTSLHMTFSMHSPRAYHFIEHIIEKKLDENTSIPPEKYTTDEALDLISTEFYRDLKVAAIKEFSSFINSLEKERLCIRNKNPLTSAPDEKHLTRRCS